MDQSSLAVGQMIVGRYRVERILGRGGMGEVAGVRHVELDEVFALKVMTAEAFKDADSVERFIREARMTAKLRSIHAVKVVDTGRLPNGAPYLVMEYLEGRDLSREVERWGAIPPADVAAYMVQACDVLTEAHTAGIVHRDLKPANLFLTFLPSGAPCIKVLDFGIAKQIDPLSDRSMTRTASVFGTPLYMSPEQMKSSKQVDPRSDIWSLGVVMYELLTGALPFDAESMTALVAKVMTEQPAPITTHRPLIPAGLSDVVMRCLERDPARRFQSAAELALALAPFAPVAAVPATLRGSSPDLVLASSNVTSLILGGMPTVRAAVPTSLASQAGGPTETRPRSRAPLLAVAVITALAVAAVGFFFFGRINGDDANGSTALSSHPPVLKPDPGPSDAPSSVPTSSSALPAVSASVAEPASTPVSKGAAPSVTKPTIRRPRPKGRHGGLL